VTAALPDELIRLWPDGPPSKLEGEGPEIEFRGPVGTAGDAAMLRNVSEPTLPARCPRVRHGVAGFPVRPRDRTIPRLVHRSGIGVETSAAPAHVFSRAGGARLRDDLLAGALVHVHDLLGKGPNSLL
jgi:hypothetical protein